LATATLAAVAGALGVSLPRSARLRLLNEHESPFVAIGQRWETHGAGVLWAPDLEHWKLGPVGCVRVATSVGRNHNGRQQHLDLIEFAE